MTDYARKTAAAACKEAMRKGAGLLTGKDLMDRLFAEADAYDVWQIHASRARMSELLTSEWRKLRGRQLGGCVSAAARRI